MIDRIKICWILHHGSLRVCQAQAEASLFCLPKENRQKSSNRPPVRLPPSPSYKEVKIKKRKKGCAYVQKVGQWGSRLNMIVNSLHVWTSTGGIDAQYTTRKKKIHMHTCLDAMGEPNLVYSSCPRRFQYFIQSIDATSRHVLYYVRSTWSNGPTCNQSSKCVVGYFHRLDCQIKVYQILVNSF